MLMLDVDLCPPIIALGPDTRCLCEVLNLAEIWKVFCLYLQKQCWLIPQQICETDLVSCKESHAEHDQSSNCMCCVKKSVTKYVKCTDGGEKINRVDILPVIIKSRI